MKAALYVRVSTEMQVEDGFSISAQTRMLTDYCKRNDTAIYKIYADEGISGQKENRPQFQHMLQDAEKKSFDVILVHKFDRFARRVELSQKIKRQLRKSGINVISITEPIEDSPIGFFTEGLMELIAEYYVKNLSVEVKKGHLERARQGFHNGSVPYGYRIDNTLPEKMCIVDEQAKVVEYIYDCYTRLGYGIAKIAKLLNESNILGAVGGKWCPRSVRMVLSNPKYIGMIKLGDQVYPALHKPIVDKHTWELAQTIDAKRSDRYTYYAENHSKRFLLGISKCSECGKAIVIRRSGKYQYYCCSGNRRVYEHICDNSMTYRVEPFEEYVTTCLKEIFEGNNTDFEIIKKSNVLDFSQDRIKTITTKLSRLKDGYLNGIFALEEYKKIKNELENELNLLNLDIEKTDKHKLVESYKTYWEQFINCSEAGEKRAILCQFISCIYIGRKDIRICFYAN